MNKLDKDYCNLLQDILDNGVKKQDRTGTGTISVFGRQIRHKMSDGFPLLTTKKMAWKTMVTELLWFLRGDTNIKYLVDNNCHIWDGDCYQAYIKRYNKGEYVGKTKLLENSKKNRTLTEPFTKEEFINKIKTDDEFAKKWGELGPIYGKQWRNWDIKPNIETKSYIHKGEIHFTFDINERPSIDQIQNLIHDLKTNPDSRRLMVNAWNCSELDQMVLPPCHYGFQMYTRELSMSEKELWYKNNNINPNEPWYPNIPTRAISLMWNQRSCDTFLGIPFNIASYGLLLEIIAKEVNMVPDELIGNLGDVHLYLNHIEQAKEQVGRKYTHEERSEMLKTAMGDFYKTAVDEQVPFGGGLSEYYDAHKIPYRTREPFELPTLKHMKTNEFYKSLGEDLSLITHLDNSDFELVNYQSHPSIKAPLSN
jgi:thymidylate synthase